MEGKRTRGEAFLEESKKDSTWESEHHATDNAQGGVDKGGKQRTFCVNISLF